MALDVGDRRIGVSISDPMKLIASPYDYLDRNKIENVIDEIIKLIHNLDVVTLVIGLPITLKGTDSIQTNKVREFIDTISKKTNITIKTIDERLSSIAAKKELINKGIKTGHNKGKVDEIAATLMLQEYLSTKESK